MEYNKKQTHIAIGNINIDFISIIEEELKPDFNVVAKDVWIGLGGAATNYAIAVSRLNHKAKLIARTGEDIVKYGFLDKLKEEGVDVSSVEISKEKPGMVMIIVNSKKSTRTMITARNANKGLRLSNEKIDGDHIHFSSVDPDLIKYAKYANKTKTISYDPGGEACYNKEKIINNIKYINWLLINENEFSCLDLDVNKLFKNYGLEFIAIKKGSKGAEIINKNKKILGKIETTINQIDPTGAGDAFNASFNIFYKSTGDINEALKYAISAGSAKVEKLGSSNMPYLDEIESKLKFVEILHY
ncbi:PfkB family carbohydrate kinase [Caldisphaera sp.]|uniref:PfkB family carbohydrate kinase n=1 Tax=Caldisphaera sp. TaxID=2060322 RepID=UPI0025BE1CD9|nr:PfkB family carbohydrate kinase [Caldisphaera sp.]